MNSVLKGTALILALSLQAASLHALTLTENIAALQKQMGELQALFMRLERDPHAFNQHAPADPGKERVLDEIRQELSQISFLLYEYTYYAKEPSQRETLGTIKGELNSMFGALTAQKPATPPPWSPIMRGRYRFRPIYGDTKDFDRANTIRLMHRFPKQSEFEGILREKQQLGEIVVAWMKEKNLTTSSTDPIGVSNLLAEMRPTLNNNEIPQSVLNAVKSFDQFQLLRTFVEERFASRTPADWIQFHTLLTEATSSERCRLASAMIIARALKPADPKNLSGAWDLPGIIRANRRLVGPAAVVLHAGRLSMHDLMTTWSFTGKDSWKTSHLLRFLRDFGYIVPARCSDVLL